MPRPRRKTQSTKQAQADIKRDARETNSSQRRVPIDQYQHFIPRFILRRFQVGPVKSKATRQREFRLTGVDPEYVRYYDISTRSLDIRPIGKVYGVQNIYQDVRNTENINELEEKLGGLERQASFIIAELHTALPRGAFTLKRRKLEDLRKFIFIMQYRNASCSTVSFQADHPDNLQICQWIRWFMKAKGIQSEVETWLHFLRYYLDTSHSDIMQHAAELLEKYGGPEGLQRMIAGSGSHFPPDLERFPSIAYHVQAENNFLSIWEAAKGEEFVLTNYAFGMWEGMAGDCKGLHQIFVVSPRIAIILRNVLLRPELKGHVKLGPLKSNLLNVDPEPAITTYSGGRNGMPVNLAFPVSVVQYRSSPEGADDSFVFKIAKLSRPQTQELNSTTLINLNDTSSLTFLSKESMLRTARAFRSLPRHVLWSGVIVPLIDELTTSMGTESSAPHSQLQPLAASSDEDVDTLVDTVLYLLLTQICTGSRQFPSAYDRAHLVHRIMEKAQPTSFAREISREVDKAFQTCKEEFEDMGADLIENVALSPLLSSLPNETSSQLFHLMIPYMSKLGAVMSGGEGILEELQDEVIVMSFLTRASCSTAVWHALSCSNSTAPKILLKLFKKGTYADRFIAYFTKFLYTKVSAAEALDINLKGQASPVQPADETGTSNLVQKHNALLQSACVKLAEGSGYDKACRLRSICGMTGPTTNDISGAYYDLSAILIGRWSRTMLGPLPLPYSSQPRKRPKARLVQTMSKSHSDLLMSNMEKLVPGMSLTTHSSSSEDTCKTWVYQMAVLNALAWLGKHRRNHMDFVLAVTFPEDFKLFEDE